jgi:hypothetical protein
MYDVEAKLLSSIHDFGEAVESGRNEMVFGFVMVSERVLHLCFRVRSGFIRE